MKQYNNVSKILVARLEYECRQKNWSLCLGVPLSNGFVSLQVLLDKSVMSIEKITRILTTAIIYNRYRTKLVYFHYLSQLGLERTFIVLIFPVIKKKRLPAARLHFTSRRFCTA